MNYPTSHIVIGNLRFNSLLLWLTLLLTTTSSYAGPREFVGQWYSVNATWQYGDELATPIDKPAVTGGDFVFKSQFTVDNEQPLVIDFKNASVIGLFQHTVTDATGNVVFSAQGGIQSDADNPFFMRHGRNLKLTPGTYWLTTQLSSAYFIAQPHPYLNELSNYQQSIKPGNLLGLVSIGILLSLGIYYAIFAYVRRRQTEVMYIVFIWSNLIFTGTSMLITPDLFNIHWLYVAGAPLLVSNIAYVFFVKGLLQIRKPKHPFLDNLAKFAIALLSILFIVGISNKHLMLECARFGVGIMMSYALIAAISRARHGYKIAYFYLIAIFTFFVIGSIAISSQDLNGIYTIYVEHIGLAAVTAETLLIGLVLGYQFSEIYREKEAHLAIVEHSLHIAHHDSLTGLPNRYAFEIEIEKLKANGMLIVLDMDNLKLYNDEYGHQKGDEMLQMFAAIMSHTLGKNALLHRTGGDEFAIISHDRTDEHRINHAIDTTIRYMHEHGFHQAGVSYGSAYVSETTNTESLHSLADGRMYQQKKMRRANQPSSS